MYNIVMEFETKVHEHCLVRDLESDISKFMGCVFTGPIKELILNHTMTLSNVNKIPLKSDVDKFSCIINEELCSVIKSKQLSDKYEVKDTVFVGYKSIEENQ